MSATPIRPGITYRVCGMGIDVIVLAPHAADALLIILETLDHV